MSLSTLRKEEEKSHSLTLPDLLAGLSELVEWETFGGLLGVPIRDIDRIKAENSSIHSMVLHLLDYLVNHIKDLSWKKVIEALEKIPKEKDLAEKLSKIHLQPQVVNSHQKIISLKDKDDFSLEFNSLIMKFARLVLNIKKTLKNEADFDDVLSFATTLQVVSNPPPVNIRELFDHLQPHYCFMKYKILEVIVFEFIKKTMEKDMEKYREALTKWQESTTIQKFKEAVQKAANTESVNPSPNQCLIVLKLEGEWLKVTLNHLWKLLEYLFGKESSIFTRLRIKEGSVLVCLFAPQSEILSLLMLASKRHYELVCFGIQSIQFGNILLFAPQLDINDSSIYKFEIGLKIAIELNNALVTQWFLDLGVDPNIDLDTCLTPANEIYVISPLMCAAAINNTEIMSLLVDYGADVHRNKLGMSPIHIATVFGNVEAIEYLLKKGVSPDQYMPGKMTPLGVASHFPTQKGEVVSFLLKRGAKIDFQDSEGYTALTGVCLRGMYSMAKLLLEKGANPNLQTNEGGTPLSLTCQQDHQFKEVVKLLLDFCADPSIPSFDGTTPLMRASTHQHHQIVKLLLQAGVYVNTTNNFGMTALHIACNKNNDIQLVNILLAANADVNIQNIMGQTPLQYACERGNAKVVWCLLMKKADLNLSSNKGCSPLHVVTQNNNVKIVKILLDAGADPNIAGNFKIAPLHLACVHSSDDIVCLILKARANPNVVTTRGHTPLSIAAERGRITVAEMLLSVGADIELADIRGWTPIFYAAAGGHLDMISFLLKHGAKLKKDKFGETIESVAAKVGGIDVKNLLQEATKQQTEKKDEATVSKEQERKDEPTADEEVTSTALTTPLEVDTGSDETTEPSPLINEDDQLSTDNSYSHYQNFLSFMSSNIGSIKQQYDNTIKRLENQMQFTIPELKLFSIN